MKGLRKFFTSSDGHLQPPPPVKLEKDLPDTRAPFVAEKISISRGPACSDSGEARSRSNALADEIRKSFHDITVVRTDYDKDIEDRDKFFAALKGEDGGGANTTEQGKAEEAWTRQMEKKYRKNKKVLVQPSRPGMAAALGVGRTVVAHSSVKGSGAAPANHPAVQEALDKLEVREREKWHGKCAEVGAVSNYLVKHDRYRTMSLEEAREHFEREGAEIFAHIPERSDGTPATDFTAEAAACGSCHFMLTELGIRHKSS